MDQIRPCLTLISRAILAIQFALAQKTFVIPQQEFIHRKQYALDAIFGRDVQGVNGITPLLNNEVG